MTKDRYRKIWDDAFALANRKGLSNDAKDFAQHCCLYAFKHRIDTFFGLYPISRLSGFMRKNYGDKGTKKRNAKFCELNDHADYMKTHEDSWFEVRNHLSVLSRYEKALFSMYHVFDIDYGQIAEVMGISKQSVRTEIISIQKKIDYFMQFKSSHPLIQFLGDLTNEGEQYKNV